MLISWDAFERVDFSPGGSGPGYSDFPPGRPLSGSATTRAGRRLAGGLVYDLDESETTEALDAPSRGVNYTIPFGLIAAIAPAARGEHARVILHGGEELQLESTRDLGEEDAGLLIFVDGSEHPEYVTWTDVERVDFDRPQEANWGQAQIGLTVKKPGSADLYLSPINEKIDLSMKNDSCQKEVP